MAPFTKANLFALFRRFTPSGYSASMIGGVGEIIFNAIAAVFARLSRAVVRDLDTQGHILTATGPAFATGTVSFARSTAGPPATVPAGTTVSTADGIRFVTTADAVFPGFGTVTPNTPATAVFPSFESNVPAEAITDVDTSTIPPASLADMPDLDVVDSSPFTGGAAAVLDLHAASYGIARQPNESDANLRDRIRHLPDTVTRAAVLGAANRSMQPTTKQAALDEPTPGMTPGSPTALSQPPLGQFYADAGYFGDADLPALSLAETRGAFLLRAPLFLASSVTTIYTDFLDFADAGQFADVGEPAIRARYLGLIRAVEDSKAAGVLPIYVGDPNL